MPGRGSALKHHVRRRSSERQYPARPSPALLESGRATPISLLLPIPPSAHATLWQPVYTTSGGRPRRTSSDPARPRNTQGVPTHAAAPPHRSPHSHRSPLLYHRPSTPPPRSHPAPYPTPPRSPSPTPGPASASAEKDDPSQIATIALGDPTDAPVPARPGDHVSNVPPTILVHLPRFGDQVGLIPDTPAGRLLYGWLAAFNQASYPALGNALPNVALASAAPAQIELPRQPAGFHLLSAQKVQPGVLVFPLRDPTPTAIEALGTLPVRPNSSPAAIASFSLRAVPPLRQDATPAAAPRSAASPR